MTGSSIGVTSGDDYATIKYSQITGIGIVNNNLPKEYSLEQNYPNPFNPNTIIIFDLPVLQAGVPTHLNPPFGKGANEQSSGGFVKLII